MLTEEKFYRIILKLRILKFVTSLLCTMTHIKKGNLLAKECWDTPAILFAFFLFCFCICFMKY